MALGAPAPGHSSGVEPVRLNRRAWAKADESPTTPVADETPAFLRGTAARVKKPNPLLPMSSDAGVGIPPNTSVIVAATMANAVIGTLVVAPPSVTDDDMRKLAVGDTVVSRGGTTREVLAINGETFTFNTITRIDGEALTFFVSEDGLTQIDFTKMKIGDRVSNGDINYTIENIAYARGEAANTIRVKTVVLSRTEIRENYRAQGFDHIARIIKKFKFQKILGQVPPVKPINGTAPTA